MARPRPRMRLPISLSDSKWATPASTTQQYDWKNNIQINKNENTDGGLAPFSKRIFAKIIDLLLWLPAFLFLTAFMSSAQHAELAKLQAQGMSFHVMKWQNLTYS